MMPPPQLLLHADQPDQVKTQCTAHSTLFSQLLLSDRGGQDFPPSPGLSTIALIRVVTPPPQVPEHAAHGAHVDTLQSIVGHLFKLHTRDFVSGHPFPPCLAETTVLWPRVCRPTPQVALHADHSCHATEQWTAQGCLLHDSSWVSTLQGSPPLSALTTTLRVLLLEPVPHL